MQHDQPEFSRERLGGRREDEDERRFGRRGSDEGRYGREGREREWDEPYGRRSSFERSRDEDFRGASRHGQSGMGGQYGYEEPGQQRGSMTGGHYGQMGQMSGQGQGSQGYGQSYGGQMGGQGGQMGGQGYYGQSFGQGQGSQQQGQDWERFGRGGQGRESWTSRPGYGGQGAFEEGEIGSSRHRGSSTWGSRSMGQRSEFRGKGPKGYRRSDERIQEEVSDVLADADVDVSNVTVQVEDGEVTLEGNVSSRWDKRQIEDIVCEVRGVKDCQNRLRVGSAEESEDIEEHSTGTGAFARGSQEHH